MSGHAIRVRSFEDLKKARRVMEEVTRGEQGQTLLVSVTDDEIHVVGGGVRGTDLWRLLWIATEAIKASEAKQKEIRLKPGPIEPRADKSGRKRVPEITTDANGELRAPPGESFLFCGECGHNTWFVTSCDDGTPGRDACTRCGNEIAYLRMDHAPGKS